MTLPESEVLKPSRLPVHITCLSSSLFSQDVLSDKPSAFGDGSYSVRLDLRGPTAECWVQSLDGSGALWTKQDKVW